MNNGVKPDALSPAQLQRLGLDTQPFDHSPPAGQPFADAAVDTQVNVALHILQHTDQVLLVQGEAGIGKSAFITLLHQTAGEELILIHLSSVAMGGAGPMFRTVAEAGGIDGEDEAAAVSALLRLWDMGQRPVLTLDDADRVPREAVEALLELHTELARRQITPGLVLTGARDLVPLVTSAAGEQGMEPHVVNLHPMDEEQTRAYIRDRLRQAGSFDGSQLTDTQCRQIHHRTRGNPANVNREATRLLAAAAPIAGQGGSKAPARWVMPVVIGAVVVLVAGLIAASVLVDEGTGEVAEIAPEPQPAEQDKTRGLPSRKNLEEKIRGSQASKPEPQQPPEEGQPQAGGTGETEQQATAPDAGPEQAETGEQDMPGTSAPQTQADAPKAQNDTDAQQAERDSEDTGKDEAPTAADGQPREESPEDTRAQVEPQQETPKQTADEAAKSPEPSGQPEPSEAEEPPADHYTIQLIGAYDRESLEDFIDALELQGRTRIVTTRREGRDWHVVVLGNYASREAANTALQRLPEAARKHGAWVRSFGSL